MDNKMIDFFVNNVEVKRYHDEEGHPRVTRTSSVLDENDLFIQFQMNYSERNERTFTEQLMKSKPRNLE